MKISVNKRFHRQTSNQRVKEPDQQCNEMGTVLGTKNYEEKPLPQQTTTPTKSLPQQNHYPQKKLLPQKTLLPQTTLFLTQHSFDDGVNKRIGG